MSDLWSNVVTGVASVAAGWGSAWFTLRHAKNQALGDRLERRRQERALVYATAHDAVTKVLIAAAEGRELADPCAEARHATAALFFIAPDDVTHQVDLLGRALNDLERARLGPESPYRQAFDQLDDTFVDLRAAMRTDLDIVRSADLKAGRREGARWWRPRRQRSD